jgi:hypothetical protein
VGITGDTTAHAGRRDLRCIVRRDVVTGARHLLLETKHGDGQSLLLLVNVIDLASDSAQHFLQMVETLGEIIHEGG